ncbi:MAG TPA: glycosyltransferase family 4 protein, partial [Acidimicrobiales bacterium]|nr:glycosyltransferase family 4 protein [Acidimicrobiales bacterium]
QVCPYSLTVPGGVQGQVLGLAAGLRAAGHQVVVLAPCDGPPPDPGVRPLGRSVPLAANGSIAPIAPDLPCALRTVAALREEPFDVVHLQEPLVPGPTLTALLYTEAAVVGTFHRSGPSTAYAALRPLVRRVARRLGVRAAVSAEAADTARQALGGEYEMVFNAVDAAAFAAAPAWPKEAPTIFFIGRHEPRKGLAVLLEAYRRLPAGTRLWIAGDGPQTDALRAASADLAGVEWLGRIGDSERASRMKGADVFCAPSVRGESFGMVLLEAMAAGTPVVAGELAGYRNVVRTDAEGLLVPVEDPEALAGALGRVLADDGLASELARAGLARAEELSMERLTRRYVELYGVAARRIGA